MILQRVKVVKGAEAVHRLTPESFGVSDSGLEALEGLMERAFAHYHHLDEIVSAHGLGETPRPFLDNLHSGLRHSRRNATTGLSSWLSEVSLNSKRHRAIIQSSHIPANHIHLSLQTRTTPPSCCAFSKASTNATIAVKRKDGREESTERIDDRRHW
jgi:hypothetical protein